VLKSADRSPIDPQKRYQLDERVDLAQRLNPETRVAWERARQAAIGFGLVESECYPVLTLAALITLADRLVTAAQAREAVASAVTPDEHVRLRRAAEGCRQLCQGLPEWQRPSSAEWIALSAEPAFPSASPLADIERTLDEIALAVPGAGVLPAHRPGFFVPDAFENRDHVRFATKGTAALRWLSPEPLAPARAS